MSVAPWTLVCAGATVALVASEYRASAAGRWVSKPLASLAFVGLALSQGDPGSSYGRAVLAALVLCLLGDLLLLPDRTGPAFIGGLASFLGGHVAFSVAFVALDPDWAWTGAAAVALALPVVGALRWLGPHLQGRLRVAVPIYVVAIGAMVALAAGAARSAGPWWVGPAAILFFLSDLAVARQRFVQRDWRNRLWGLPLYYAAQLLFALSILDYSPNG
jgi:uncharacterized membrane protein YhhN